MTWVWAKRHSIMAFCDEPLSRGFFFERPRLNVAKFQFPGSVTWLAAAGETAGPVYMVQLPERERSLRAPPTSQRENRPHLPETERSETREKAAAAVAEVVNSLIDVAALSKAYPVGPLDVRVTGADSVNVAMAIHGILLDGMRRGWTSPSLPRLLQLACLGAEVNHVVFELIPRLEEDRNDLTALLLLLHGASWSVRRLGRINFGEGDGARAACNAATNRLLLVTRRVLSAKTSTDWLHGQLPDLTDRFLPLITNHPIVLDA